MTPPPNQALPALEEFPSKGTPPKTRVRDSKSAYSMWSACVKDDDTNAKNRALVDDVAEGAPPYTDEDIQASGQEGRFNFNSGELAALRRAAITSYWNLVEEVNSIAHLMFPETMEDDSEDAEKEQIIAEEFHQMLREWPDFNAQWDWLCLQLVSHGVALAFHPDEKTWKFKAVGLDDFYLPRQCRNSEDAVQFLFVRERFPLHELYKFIQNEKAAAAGWDVDCVREALCRASKGTSYKPQDFEATWRTLQDELANNDLGVSYTTGEFVDAAHGLFREFDGSFTHVIFTLSDNGGKNFLFRKNSRYAADDNFFTIFTANPGRGTYQSIRGLLYQAYPIVMAGEQMRMQMLDHVRISLSHLFETESQEALEGLSVALGGPVNTLPPGIKARDAAPMANLAVSAIPVMREMALLGQNVLGQYQQRGVMPEGQERTKYEVAAAQALNGSLTVSQVTRFYKHLKRLLTSVFKRVQKLGPGGGGEVADFYERCLLRGVTADDIKRIERVEPNKAAGFGSQEMKLAAFTMSQDLFSTFDEIGRHRWLYDRTAALFGVDGADRYVGRKQKPRFILDAKIAELENSSLRDDPGVQAAPGENHAIHAQVHMGRALKVLTELMEIVSQGGQLDVAALSEPVQYAGNILNHTQPHLEQVAVDISRRELFGELKKMFQQLSAQWVSIIRALRAAERNQESQGEDGGAGNAASLQAAAQLQEHQLKMQMAEEKHQQAMRQESERARQKLAIQRAEADVKISANINKQALALAQPRTSR